MRGSWIGVGAIFLLFVGANVSAQTPAGLEESLRALFKTYAPGAGDEAPRIVTDELGNLTFIGAPAGAQFTTPVSRAKSAFTPDDVAAGFMAAHGRAFGVASPSTSFRVYQVSGRGGRNYVRLQQSYGGVDVFGGAAVVQVGPDGGVLAVLSDIMRQTDALDRGELSLIPTLSANGARSVAISTAAAASGYSHSEISAASAQLYILRPSVVGLSGATRLVWYVEASASGLDPYHDAMLVDAHSGQVVHQWTLVHTIKDRRVYNAQNQFVIRRNLVRREGDPPTGVRAVDDAYDFLGNTYDFYFQNHQRDAIDGRGAPMHATVNFGINFFNAFWDGTDMVFGLGFLTDDITGHELTHGVTQFESNLIYFAESGAINESFSDIWGEFIDLTNTAGNDSPSVRWLMGEDSIVGAVRSMSDPTQFTWFPFDGGGREFTTPDRYNHPDFYRGIDDNGGVHINSGVGNKLAYLLTDGDSFNGFTVQGLGIPLVADLFYEAQLTLTPAANYFDLFSALGQGSANLGLTFDQRLNILNGARAVEIEPLTVAQVPLGFRALPAKDSRGQAAVTLAWRQSGAGNPILVRKQGAFPTSPSDGQRLGDSAQLSTGAFVDRAVTSGAEYFYGLFIDKPSGFPDVGLSRATAGNLPPDFQTEIFSRAAGRPMDLAFSQLLFSPVIDERAARASGSPSSYVDHSNYTASIRRNIVALPVGRNDGGAGAISIPLRDDDVVVVSLGSATFPYFGARFNRLNIGANGYIDFGAGCVSCSGNFPSLAAHANSPRISFLFSDLSFSTSGSAWLKSLDDRIVVTFENVPALGALSARNTAQVELFYSGHIRITYLALNVDEAIVGLSDGRGVPRDPAELLPGTPSLLRPSDFSGAPLNDPNRLTIWPPVPTQAGIAGGVVSFTVTTISPNGIPALSAAWDLMAPVPFADNGNGTGTFHWNVPASFAGMATVNIVAELGSEVASQTIPITITGVSSPPSARNLGIATGEPGENPFAPRKVDPDLPLTAVYTYLHPELHINAALFAEGDSRIRWYRNSFPVSSLDNQRAVPADATQIGDAWFFTLVPVTVQGVEGARLTSPTVTVGGDPVVSAITPPEGPYLGGTVVRVTGRRLGNPQSVTFGGIRGEALRTFGPEELEVVAPVSRPGIVDVVVSTVSGSVTVPGGFRFIGPNESKVQADVNGDGAVDAVDVQLVIDGVLKQTKDARLDANGDGRLTSADVQVVVVAALRR